MLVLELLKIVSNFLFFGLEVGPYHHFCCYMLCFTCIGLFKLKPSMQLWEKMLWLFFLFSQRLKFIYLHTLTGLK